MDSKVLARRLITASGTFLCALSLGYFMQATARSGPVAEANPAEQGASPDSAATPISADLEDTTRLLPPRQDKVSKSPLYSQDTANMWWAWAKTMPVSDTPRRRHASEPVPEPTRFRTRSDYETLIRTAADPTPLCDVSLTGRKSLAATARLSLQADCLPHTPFTVHHSGMVFSDVTDETGRWERDIPALVEQALFIVDFANGQSAVTSVFVDTIPLYHRYVLQWQGNSDLELHALEEGAEFGAAGHVWSGAARDVSAAVHGEGGFVTILGSVNAQAEVLTHSAMVYTAASYSNVVRPGIRIEARATVNEENCSRDIGAQVLSQNPRFGRSAQDLIFAMPDCSGIGEDVVVNILDHAVTMAVHE